MNNIVVNYLELLQAQLQGKDYIMQTIAECEEGVYSEKYTLKELKDDIHEFISYNTKVEDFIDIGCIELDRTDTNDMKYISDISENENIYKFPSYLTDIITHMYTKEDYIFDDGLNLKLSLYESGVITIILDNPPVQEYYYESVSGPNFKGSYACECGHTLLRQEKECWDIFEPDYMCPNCNKMYRF